MRLDENKRFLDTALNQGLITLDQFNRITEAWKKDATRDTGILLLEHGFLTPEQYRRIFALVMKGEGIAAGEGGEAPYVRGFALSGLLGQGGIGRVFLGQDQNIRRPVAIKELVGSGREEVRERERARFQREARICGQLEHPGVVPVYELGTKEDGTSFYVMKYVQGRSLHEALAACEGKTPEEAFRKRLALLDNIIGVCDAMAYAHSRGIIHRDLKPSNIVIGEFGESIILDWGLAKALHETEPISTAEIAPARLATSAEDASDDILTRHGALVGTPSYMSPEQIEPRYGEVGPVSDVFALGILLYLILTGEKPYRGKASEVMKMIASDDPAPSPRPSHAYIPAELAAICEKAMAKAQKDRFLNAGALSAELKAYRDGRIVSVYAYSTGELIRRFVARNKAAIGAAAAILLSILGGLGFATHYAIVADQERTRAERALVDVTRISEEATELARTTVGRFDAYFQALGKELWATAREAKQAGDPTPPIVALMRRLPEVRAVLFERGGTSTAVPADAAGTIRFPPPDIPRISIEGRGGHVSLTDAWKTADGHYAFAFTLDVDSDTRFTAVFIISEIMPLAFDFDPLKSPYQVWCMDQDGSIIYDEDEHQIGKVLFTDAMYANYPELLSLGKDIRDKPWGVGTYTFTMRDSNVPIHKIAAWDTLSPAPGVEWDIVVTFPYKER